MNKAAQLQNEISTIQSEIMRAKEALKNSMSDPHAVSVLVHSLKIMHARLAELDQALSKVPKSGGLASE